MKAFGKSLGRKGKQLFMPVRLAMTGRLSGPDIPKQLRLLAAAPEQALVESVPFGERIASLESVLSAMEAEVESEPVVV